MRLPTGARMGVQSLGRQDINAPAREYQSKVNVRNAMLGAAEGVITESIELKNKYDVSLADAHVIQSMTDLEGKYGGKDYIDANDPILSGLKYDKMDEFGKARTRIPSHEVYTQMYANQSKKAITEGGGMIGFNNTKSQWSGEYKEKAQQNIASIQVKNDQKEQKYREARQIDIAENQLALGNYDAVENTMDNFVGSDIVADSIRLKARVGKENEKTAVAINTEDPTAMIRRAEQLEDMEKSNVLSNEVRLKEATRLRKTAKAQATNNDAATAHAWYQGQKGNGQSDEQVLKAAKAIEDPAVSKLAQQAARQGISDRESAENRLKSDNYDEIYSAVTQGGADGRMSHTDFPAPMWATLSPAQQNSILAAEKNPDSYYDPEKAMEEAATMDVFMEAAQSGDSQAMKDFASFDIIEATAGWGEPQKAQARKLHADTRAYLNKDGPAPEGSTFDQTIKQAYGQMFNGETSLGQLEVKDQAKAAKFKARLAEEVNIFTDNTGKKPDSAWMNSKSLELQQEDYLFEVNWGLDTDFRAFEMQVEGIPDNLIDDLGAYLRSQDIDVTQHTLKQAFDGDI